MLNNIKKIVEIVEGEFNKEKEMPPQIWWTIFTQILQKSYFKYVQGTQQGN